MGSFSINFNSGAGMRQGDPREKDPLYSLLKGSDNSKTAANSLFGKKKTASDPVIPTFLKTRLEAQNDLKAKNKTLWGFLHPGQKTDENNAIASVEDPYGIKEMAEAEKKRLKYNYKSVSKKIIQSKDSNSAEKAVTAARQATRDLKRQAAEGKCDAEDIEAALLHAKRMENLAEKHLKFIKEEETAEHFQKEGNVTAAFASTPLVEDSESALYSKKEADEDLKKEVRDYLVSLGYEFKDDAAAAVENTGSEDLSELAAVARNADAIDTSASARDAAWNDMASLTEDMTEEMSNELSDLSDMLDTPDLYGMDPSEVKLLKQKHRAKEMKEMAEADAEYLKAVFEKMNESMHTDAAAQAAGAFGGGSASLSQGVSSDPLGIMGAPGANVDVVL